MAADHLSRQRTGLLGYVRDAMDWVGKAPSRLQDRVANGRQNLAKVVTGLYSGDDVGEIDDSEPASLIGPPTVNGNLSGTMTGPGGTATQLTGYITAFHNFSASGLHTQGDVAISGSIDTNGAVTDGSFSIGSTTGTVRPPGTPDPVTPGNPGDGVSHDGKFISGTGTTHTRPGGLVATGHRIVSIASRPSSAGLKVGTNVNKNSKGEYHGLYVFLHSDGSMSSVSYYENGVQTASGGNYQSDGTPFGEFGDYINGQREGVWYFLQSFGDWTFSTYSAGTLHGPFGQYLSDGTRTGCFGQYVNGSRSGTGTYYRWDGSTTGC